MSLKPGIGARWFDLYKDDVYPRDEVVVRGRPMKPPKYYDRMYELLSPKEMMFVRHKRKRDAKKGASDQTYDRLAVREKVKQASISLLKRTL